MNEADSVYEMILDSRFSILDSRHRVLPLFALLGALAGCSSPYNVRISDDKSASNGPLYFHGWADPPLIPGTRLADAPSGSRVVLWNEAGLEAIVDIGDTCPVLIRDKEGARKPSGDELAVIASVFPTWTVAASTRASDYADERRLDRLFPSHIEDHVKRLEGAAAVDFALGESPAGWLNRGGRTRALIHAAGRAEVQDLGRVADGARRLDKADRKLVLSFIWERDDLTPRELLELVAAGEPEMAVDHEAADESVCLAAIEVIAKQPLSSDRRSGLESVLESPGATDRVRERALEVPLAYPEDRDAVRAKAGK